MTVLLYPPLRQSPPVGASQALTEGPHNEQSMPRHKKKEEALKCQGCASDWAGECALKCGAVMCMDCAKKARASMGCSCCPMFTCRPCHTAAQKKLSSERNPRRLWGTAKLN